MPKKLITIVILSLLLIGGIAIVIVGFIPLQYPVITKQISTIARANGFDTCSIDTATVRLWKSIEMRGLSMKTNEYSNAFLDLNVDYCRIEPKLLYIIPYLFRFTGKQARNTSIEQKIKLLKAFYMKCSLLQIRRNGDNVLLKNFEFNAKDKNYDFAKYNGEFKIDSVLTDLNVFTSIDGNMEFNDSGFVKIKECQGKLRGGNVTCDGVFDLKKERINFVNAHIFGVNIKDYYTTGNKYSSKVSGTADLTIKLTESAFEKDSLTGNGKFTVSDVYLEDLPIQRAIVSLLGFPQLQKLEFDTIRSNFVINYGQIKPDTIRGVGPMVEFSSIGWFHVNGTLNQNITCILKREFVETLPGVVSEAMHRTADNGRYFKCRLYGSIDHPKIEFSKETLQKAISGAFDSMKQQIEKAFTGK